MKQTTIAIFCLFIFFCNHNAAAESTLVKIAKADGKDIAQVFFSFDSLPKYSQKIGNKRIDILLEKTRRAEEFQLFATDDRIIRVVPTTRNDMTIVSFFFRYQPQKVQLDTSSDGKLVLEILLGNRYSRSYQDLSERLKGLTVVEEEKIDYSNPLLSSPYAYNWKSFIQLYEPPINISVPIEYTTPPFPAIALIPPGLEKNSELLPAEMLQTAALGDWNTLVPLFLDLLKAPNGLENQKMIALTYGEVLLRAGDYEGAFKQLYLLKEKYPDEHIGIIAKYLLILLDAKFRDPYLADYNFREMEQLITPDHPLAPYLLLSRVETALATKQFEQARLLLNRDDIAFPGNTQKIRELRQGDYYNGTAQLVKAYVSYVLLKDSTLLHAHPYSQNGYCNTIYLQKKFEQAASCYRELAPRVSDTAALGLISYRTSMAELHFQGGNTIISGFARVADAFPDTEAGSRAAIKQTDLKFLYNTNWGKQAADQYNQIAATSVLRPTVAEASFKEAIVWSLIGQKGKAIELLTDFLRNFRISDIRDSALALLIDLLPGEIERLIKEGKNMEALVLAKQNRELFQNNWISLQLLAQIAEAYQKVGIYSEAQRVYLYLLEMSDVDKREQYFLPLVRAAFEQGEYSLVEDFGSQYNYNYGQGNDNLAILLLRIKALIATSRFDEAGALLPSPLPENTELQLLAADIYFHDLNYASSREVLERLNDRKIPLPIDAQFRLAESKYQLADYPGAATLFTALVDSKTIGQQSLFRLAQIERKQGNEENALKLFRKIVDKGTDDLWKQYAQKEIEYSELNSSIEKMTNP
ncbi:Tetratricopeptide repeat-containing protein [Desulfopila aestuarii DSM 18488]|uniref:Tetratricopeptide repeat-containing protein n=1 Tax=Desulfopila aestuarii DSM 18488 TaxID=1121416 RepID=A0A1M7YDI5_9BACT|nr:Tetratricopeptide repeat-containing protein [Desulfopila aestuarii DSM 18488]